MTPTFQLPSGYASREMIFALTRDGRGWRFVAHADGYQVPALNPAGKPLCDGVTFTTKREAAMMAEALNLPPYAVWNGRKRCYTGHGARFTVHARDAAQ